MEAGALPRPGSASLGRIGAVMLRQALLYKRTFYRWLDIIYWPAVDLVLWGLITRFLQQQPTGIPRAAGFFLGALILWEIFFRAQLSVTVGFLEDVWSRNLLNVCSSPIRPSEYLAGNILIGAARVALGGVISAVLARALFGFNLLTIGLPLIPFALALAAMGWALGVVATAVILWFGEGAEALAWAIAFVFQPFAAVFYPVSILPAGVRGVAHGVAASHVFEGMRQVIAGGPFPAGELAWAAALDAAYLAAAWLLFLHVLRRSREKGLLARFGE